jgi:hypothetical protein
MSEADYFEFNKNHLLSSPGYRKSIRRLRIMVPAIFALMLLYYRFVKHEDWEILLTVAVIFALFSVLFFFVAKPYARLYRMCYIRINIWRMKKRGNLPYTTDGKLEFYDDYFGEDLEKGEYKLKYSAVVKVVEGSGAVYVYISETTAIIIPFSSFESDSQRAEFIAFINEKRQSV